MSAQGRSLAGWLRLKTVQSILVCLFYASSSITLSVVNKAVLSSYDFQCYFLLLAIQLVVGIVFCAASRRLGNPLSVPSIRDPSRLLAAAPMATFFVINVSVGCVRSRRARGRVAAAAAAAAGGGGGGGGGSAGGCWMCAADDDLRLARSLNTTCCCWLVPARARNLGPRAPRAARLRSAASSRCGW